MFFRSSLYYLLGDYIVEYFYLQLQKWDNYIVIEISFKMSYKMLQYIKGVWSYEPETTQICTKIFRWSLTAVFWKTHFFTNNKYENAFSEVGLKDRDMPFSAFYQERINLRHDRELFSIFYFVDIENFEFLSKNEQIFDKFQ